MPRTTPAGRPPLSTASSRSRMCRTGDSCAPRRRGCAGPPGRGTRQQRRHVGVVDPGDLALLAGHLAEEQRPQVRQPGAGRDEQVQRRRGVIRLAPLPDDERVDGLPPTTSRHQVEDVAEHLLVGFVVRLDPPGDGAARGPLGVQLVDDAGLELDHRKPGERRDVPHAPDLNRTHRQFPPPAPAPDPTPVLTPAVAAAAGRSASPGRADPSQAASALRSLVRYVPVSSTHGTRPAASSARNRPVIHPRRCSPSRIPSSSNGTSSCGGQQVQGRFAGGGADLRRGGAEVALLPDRGGERVGVADQQRPAGPGGGVLGGVLLPDDVRKSSRSHTRSSTLTPPAIFSSVSSGRTRGPTACRRTPRRAAGAGRRGPAPWWWCRSTRRRRRPPGGPASRAPAGPGTPSWPRGPRARRCRRPGRPASWVDRHVPRVEPSGELVAVHLGGEHHVDPRGTDGPAEDLIVRLPDVRVVVVDRQVAQDAGEPHVRAGRVHLTQPLEAGLERDGLGAGRRDDDGDPVAGAGRRRR